MSGDLNQQQDSTWNTVVSMMYMYDQSQLTSLDAAVLVSFYRYLRCCRGSVASKQEMLQACETEITDRGIDLDALCGDTRFTGETETLPLDFFRKFW